MTDNTLKARQEAGERVEARVLEMLLHYAPAQDLSVGNVKQIAFAARQVAFDEFSQIEASK